MLCDEDLTIDREKFMKLMKATYDETNKVINHFTFPLFCLAF